MLKQKHFIDLSKGLTPLVVLGLMQIYLAWENSTAWIYLALHGSYGILWVVKSQIFPDKQWEQKCSSLYGLYIFGGLAFYWIAPWIICSQNVQVSPRTLGLCVALYAFGVFLHFTSDMQKHLHLKWRSGTLLEDGLWARIRNPNYLGELGIYLSFAILSKHWAPFAVLALFMVIVWIPNMRKKDRSLSRYPAFAAYRARSWMLIPGVY